MLSIAEQLLQIVVVERVNEVDDKYYVQGTFANTDVETCCLSEREHATL